MSEMNMLLESDPQAAVFACRTENRRAGYYDHFINALPKNPARILDVGCGSGRLVVQFAGSARFVVGLDISPVLIELAQQRQVASQLTNIAWVVADAQALPFATASFDYITSTMVLRYTDLDLALPELQRVTRPNGRVAIQDLVKSPERFGFWEAFLRQIYYLIPPLTRTYGWRGMLRLVAYHFTPAGVHDMRINLRLTPRYFERMYRQNFIKGDLIIESERGKILWNNTGENRISAVPGV